MPPVKRNKKHDSRIFAVIPLKLKNALMSSAKKSGRTLTTELIARIAHSLGEQEYIERMPDFINEQI